MESNILFLILVPLVSCLSSHQPLSTKPLRSSAVKTIDESLKYYADAVKVVDESKQFFEAAYLKIVKHETNYRYLIREFARAEHSLDIKCGSSVTGAVHQVKPFQEFKKEFETIKNKVVNVVDSLKGEYAEAVDLGKQYRNYWKTTIPSEPSAIHEEMLKDGNALMVPDMNIPPEIWQEVAQRMPSDDKGITQEHRDMAKRYMPMAQMAVGFLGHERVNKMALAAGLNHDQIAIAKDLLGIKER